MPLMSSRLIYIFAAMTAPIGVFDSGYGGLTVLEDLRRRLPQYDFLYLGDNARAPYGGRSFDLVYRFTLQAVNALFDAGAPLVILACNTASSKALRSIQQRDLPAIGPDRRVLGVIRPTAEAIGGVSRTGVVGLFGTEGTVASRSYDMELAKLHPGFRLYSRACPLWVPIIENGEADSDGADWFVHKYVEQLLDSAPDNLDTIILGCTHYPLLYNKIRAAVPSHITLLRQGPLVADSLADYLIRHPEMERRLSRGGSCHYLTTEEPGRFARQAGIFMPGSTIHAGRIELS